MTDRELLEHALPYVTDVADNAVRLNDSAKARRLVADIRFALAAGEGDPDEFVFRLRVYDHRPGRWFGPYLADEAARVLAQWDRPSDEVSIERASLSLWKEVTDVTGD